MAQVVAEGEDEEDCGQDQKDRPDDIEGIGAVAKDAVFRLLLVAKSLVFMDVQFFDLLFRIVEMAGRTQGLFLPQALSAAQTIAIHDRNIVTKSEPLGRPFQKPTLGCGRMKGVSSRRQAYG